MESCTCALIISALLVASSMLVPQEGTVLGLFRLQSMGIAGYIIAAIIGVGSSSPSSAADVCDCSRFRTQNAHQ